MDQIWINVKCDPAWRDFWRSAFESIVPAYHMNKEHWNSIILDGTIPQEDIERLILESYELTKPRKTGKKPLLLEQNQDSVPPCKTQQMTP